MTDNCVVSGLSLRLWEEVLDAWDSVRLRTTSTQWNVPGRYGPYGEFFFFLLQKEQMVNQGVGPVWVSYPSRKSESMCLDRSAHDD